MNGDWPKDAKNGTMKRLSAISRLPGPIGQAVCAYRRVAEKNKVDAAHGVECGRPEHHVNPPPQGMARLPPPTS